MLPGGAQLPEVAIHQPAPGAVLGGLGLAYFARLVGPLPPMTAMVLAEGVHKRFGRLEVLKGISLEVQPALR